MHGSVCVRVLKWGKLRKDTTETPVYRRRHLWRTDVIRTHTQTQWLNVSSSWEDDVNKGKLPFKSWANTGANRRQQTQRTARQKPRQRAGGRVRRAARRASPHLWCSAGLGILSVFPPLSPCTLLPLPSICSSSVPSVSHSPVSLVLSLAPKWAQHTTKPTFKQRYISVYISLIIRWVLHAALNYCASYVLFCLSFFIILYRFWDLSPSSIFHLETPFQFENVQNSLESHVSFQIF